MKEALKRYKEALMPRRVVVTGLGMVSPLGPNVEISWKRLIAGESGIVPIDIPFVKNIKVAGIVSDFDPAVALKGFVEKKDLRRISRPAQFAAAAAIEACRDARLIVEENKVKNGINPNGVSLRIATGLGGGFHISKVSEVAKVGGDSSPFDVLQILSGRVASVPGMKIGFKGSVEAPEAECAGANMAITDGEKEIVSDSEVDFVLVGGAESTIEHVSLNVFDGAKALSYETDPKKASRPFDKNRKGFVMGEGAAILILEEKRHAEKRGAKIYAELAGYGNTSDAHHDTAPSPDGEGAIRAMEKAIKKMGGLPKKGLIFFLAHGTGTEINDPIELSAINKVMKKHGHNDFAISSTKGATGHSLAAAGGFNAVFGSMAMKEGILPPTINLENPIDEAQGIDIVANKARKAKPVLVFSNALGFGGINSVIIFKKYRMGFLRRAEKFLKKKFDRKK